MKKSILGKTGIEVSKLCIGSWQLGGPLFFNGKPDGHPDPGKSNVIRMIHELADLGINHIDSAEQYSNGESERRIAEAIDGKRDQWVISTKFGYRVGENGSRIDDSSPETILNSLEGSLNRLKTDYIDIYLFHCAPEILHLDESKKILDRAKSDGKIRAYGISTANYKLTQVMVEKQMVDILQYPANLLNDEPQMRALAEKNQIGTQVRGVMAQGRLSGKYFHQNPEWKKDDNRSEKFNHIDYTKYASLEQFLPENYSMSQMAIRYILDFHCNHTICMGAKSLNDYKKAIQALELPLIPESVRAEMSSYIKKHLT